jgi:uncharacterized protein
MNLFFDSSALLKRYLNELGDEKVQKLFEEADKVFISIITHLECASSFKRLLHTKFINEKEYQQLHIEITLDLPFFETIHFDEDVKSNALKIIEKYPMKALDTIQLASLVHVSNEIDSFIVCDQKLKKYAIKEGFHIIDPTE